MPQAVVDRIKMVALAQQAAVFGRLCLNRAHSVGIVTVSHHLSRGIVIILGEGFPKRGPAGFPS